MEPDVSIESACLIRIVVLQIGDYSHSTFQDLSSLVMKYRKVELASLKSFYSEHQKSPFSYLPWDTASLELKFITGNTRKSNWDDFQAQRKIFGLIGISHCSSSSSSSSSSASMDRYYEEFTSYSKYYSFAQTKRCLLFNSDVDSTLDSNEVELDEKKKTNLVVFPKSNREKIESLLETVMFDFCASLLMSFESWILHSDPVGGTISSPLDSPQLLASEDPSKARKRRLARMKKSTGDFCLLAGSPLDSHGHYSSAVKLAKECFDTFWLAGALEGTVSAIVMENRGKETKIVDEVLNRYTEILQLYKRASTLIFELEASIKLSRFLSRFKDYYTESSKILAEAIETSRQLTNLNDKLVFYTEVAQIYGQMGYFRKSSFFCHEIVDLYSQQNSKNASFCALKILIQSAFVYNIQTNHFFSRRSVSPQALMDNSEGRIFQKNSKSLQKRSFSLPKNPENWNLLQINILNEILSFSLKAGEPLIAFFASSQLLRNFFTQISSNGQTSLLLIVSSTSQKLPRGIRLPYPFLPFVNFLGILMPSKQSEIIKRYDGENWWINSASSNPFIYSPFSFLNNKKSEKMFWVMNELVQVMLELSNPCEFEVKIENIFLNTSTSFKTFPHSITLPPKTFSKRIVVNGHPLKSGEIIIHGVFVQCFGILTEHKFEDNIINETSTLSPSPSSLSINSTLLFPSSSSQSSLLTNANTMKNNKSENVEILNVMEKKFRVLPEIPCLVARFSGLEAGPILLEGEKRGVLLKLSNISRVPVVMGKLNLQGKHVSHVAKIFHEDLENSLPILPGHSVEIRILLEGKFPSEGHNIGTYYSGKEDVSALLDIYYAGKIEYMSNSYEIYEPSQNGTDQSSELNPPTNLSLTPGRKLSIPIKAYIQRGLNIVKARFLSVPFNNILKNSVFSAKICLFHDQDNKIDLAEKSVLRILELELLNDTEMSFEVFAKLRNKKCHTIPRSKDGEKEEKEEEMEEIINVEDEVEDENQPENGGEDKKIDDQFNVDKQRFETSESSAEKSLWEQKIFNFSMQKSRHCIVERDCSARLLIPLQIFCNDWESFIDSENESPDDVFTDVDINNYETPTETKRREKMSERDITQLIVDEICGKVFIFWRSGRNCQGKLMIKNSILQGIENIGLDLFLPCPISFDFRMTGMRKDKMNIDDMAVVPVCQLSKVEITIFNHCDRDVSISLDATCRDVKGTNSISQARNRAGVLSAGALSGIELRVPSKGSLIHRSALCFLVPGEYNLLVEVSIISPKFVFKGSKKTYSCNSNPFKVLVVGSS